MTSTSSGDSSPELPQFGNLVLPYDLYTGDDIASRIIYVEASRGCPFTCEFCLSSLDIPVRQAPLPAAAEEDAARFADRCDERVRIRHFAIARVQYGQLAGAVLAPLFESRPVLAVFIVRFSRGGNNHDRRIGTTCEIDESLDNRRVLHGAADDDERLEGDDEREARREQLQLQVSQLAAHGLATLLGVGLALDFVLIGLLSTSWRVCRWILGTAWAVLRWSCRRSKPARPKAPPGKPAIAISSSMDDKGPEALPSAPAKVDTSTDIIPIHRSDGTLVQPTGAVDPAGRTNAAGPVAEEYADYQLPGLDLLGDREHLRLIHQPTEKSTTMTYGITVRLRAPFDAQRYPSAASRALRDAARSELDALLTRAAA